MKTYYIKTYGCQMNVSDSERIAGFLEKSLSGSPFGKGRGFKPAKNINEADLVIFNTCGVRQSAEDRIYGQIHNLVESRKSKAQKAQIILTGCLADRKDVQRRLKGKVDIFVPIHKFFNIKTLTDINCYRNLYQPLDYLRIKPKHTNNFTAYVPIMTGCDNFCSYCVVPYARGREVSRPAEKIVKEVKGLIKRGNKEIVLLGQNVNSYKDGKTNFSKLLEKINAIPGHFWISFVSNHPKDVTDEMIEAVARYKKVCECFHLPIQAGNDEVIKSMNRKYTAGQYLKLVDKIKKAFKKYKPGVLYSITSDIIVGFPGETRKQFLDTAKVMEKVKYDMVYFGQYSPRPGTTAWNMKDNISKKEKVRREKYLNEILKKTAYENNRKYVGKVLEILVTEAKLPLNRSLASKKMDYFGRTRTGKNVKVYPVESSRSENAVGVFNRVKITKANIWNLEGALQKE